MARAAFQPRRRLLLTTAASASATLLTTGCSTVALMLARPATTPMPTLRPPSPCGAGGRAQTLLVLLPGAYSTPQEFIDNGTPAALRAAGRRADLCIADSHLGYVGDGSLVRRLHDDVVAPARAAGYAQVWLVGISLGGYAALAYLARNPGARVDGVFAIAPYLGRRTQLRDMAAAGGPRAWNQGLAAPDLQDLDQAIWRWLAAPPAGAPPVYLGWGREDRFADTCAVAATLLPPERVSQVAGGHDWPPWRALLAQWFQQAPWPSGCAVGTVA